MCPSHQIADAVWGRWRRSILVFIITSRNGLKKDPWKLSTLSRTFIKLQSALSVVTWLAGWTFIASRETRKRKSTVLGCRSRCNRKGFQWTNPQHWVSTPIKDAILSRFHSGKGSHAVSLFSMEMSAGATIAARLYLTSISKVHWDNKELLNWYKTFVKL